MLTIPAKTVYINPEIDRYPNCRERLVRVLPHVRCDDVRDLDDQAWEKVFSIGKRRHALGDAMKMSPDKYICNCGPQTTPGAALYDKWNAALVGRGPSVRRARDGHGGSCDAPPLLRGRRAAVPPQKS